MSSRARLGANSWPSYIDKLSTQLLVHMLKHLDPQELEELRSVCKRWNKTIKESAELAYPIDLQKYGYKDNAYHADSELTPERVAARLQELHRLEEAWLRLGDSLEKRPRPEPITVPVSSREWGSDKGDVFFQVVRQTFVALTRTGLLDVAHLSQPGSGQNTDVQFVRCDLKAGDFEPAFDVVVAMDFDPDQNVLAFAAYKGSTSGDPVDQAVYSYVLSIRETEQNGVAALSAQQNGDAVHISDVKISGLSGDSNPGPKPKVDISIRGTYITAALTSPIIVHPQTRKRRNTGQDIVLYDWSTGDVIKRLISSVDSVLYRGAAVVCDTYFFVLRHDLGNLSPLRGRYILRNEPWDSEIEEPDPLDMTEAQYQEYQSHLGSIEAEDDIGNFAPFHNSRSRPVPPYTTLSLDVYRIDQGKINDARVTMYEFPRMMDVRRPMLNQSFSVTWRQASNARIRRNQSEQTDLSPTDAIIQFTLEYELGPRFSFVCPVKTFIEPISSGYPQRLYLWSQWGPGNTYVTDSEPVSRVVYVSGYHAICPDSTREIIDFNPFTISMFTRYHMLLPPNERTPPYQDLPEEAKLVLPDGSGYFNMSNAKVFGSELVQSSLCHMVQPAPALKLYRSGEPWSCGEFFVQDLEGIKVLVFDYV
ncbi:hypothetical protein K474DRAFT_1760533 [Panus rudis PR-1116 ss-1]|nr:hypothetical protein K474DRAFT_1760533 [Panus rudis PR-1116 ss-1]